MSAVDEDGELRSRAYALSEGAVVYQMPYRDLFRAIEPHATALVDTIVYLHDQLTKSPARTEMHGLRRVRARLAHTLLQLAGDDGRVLATRSELAVEIATAPEEVMRALCDFQTRGWIAFEPCSPEILVLRSDELALL